MQQNPSLSVNGHDDAALAAPKVATDAELAEAWFDAPPSSTRRSSAPPPVSAVGEFLGDPLADAWLR
jgi:hypothetical protein